MKRNVFEAVCQKTPFEAFRLFFKIMNQYIQNSGQFIIPIPPSNPFQKNKKSIQNPKSIVKSNLFFENCDILVDSFGKELFESSETRSHIFILFVIQRMGLRVFDNQLVG